MAKVFYHHAKVVKYRQVWSHWLRGWEEKEKIIDSEKIEEKGRN